MSPSGHTAAAQLCTGRFGSFTNIPGFGYPFSQRVSFAAIGHSALLFDSSKFCVPPLATVGNQVHPDDAAMFSPCVSVGLRYTALIQNAGRVSPPAALIRVSDTPFRKLKAGLSTAGFAGAARARPPMSKHACTGSCVFNLGVTTMHLLPIVTANYNCKLTIHGIYDVWLIRFVLGAQCVLRLEE